MKHFEHPEIEKRLKRSEGHLKKVIAMLAEGRACHDIAQQLHAVESAISSAKKALIHAHIEHCLGQAAEKKQVSAKLVLEELKQLAKYL